MSQDDLYDYSDEQIEEKEPKATAQVPAKKAKKPLTDKQLVARKKNLEIGRAKRMKNIESKKNHKKVPIESDSDSSSESDEEFVLSKKQKKQKGRGEPHLKKEMEDIKFTLAQLVELEKKKRRKDKPSKTNLVVVNPAPTQSTTKVSNSDSAYFDQLRKSIFA